MQEIIVARRSGAVFVVQGVGGQVCVHPPYGCIHRRGGGSVGTWPGRIQTRSMAHTDALHHGEHESTRLGPIGAGEVGHRSVRHGVCLVSTVRPECARVTAEVSLGCRHAADTYVHSAGRAQRRGRGVQVAGSGCTGNTVMHVGLCASPGWVAGCRRGPDGRANQSTQQPVGVSRLNESMS